jgi:hypothetical protein
MGLALLAAAPAQAETTPSLYLDRVSVSFLAPQAAPGRAAAGSLLDWHTPPVARLLAERPQQARSSSSLAQRARRAQQRSRPYRQAQRATAAVAMGILGALAGGLMGAALGGMSGGEDGVLAGFAIGMPAGAAAGAVLGMVLVR